MQALILEDNVILAQSLQELLSKEGWQTSSSHSWSSASALLEKSSVDLLVLDVLLPDKNGLEILSQGIFNPSLKIVLISGFFDESSILQKIPQNLKNNCVFFKKPIDEKAFSNFLKSLKTSEPKEEEHSIFEFFFEKSLPSKPLSFYLSEDKTFHSKELIPVISLTYLKKFTGQLKITIGGKQENLIEFHRGNITRLISNSKKSFFGALLVEHGLSLQEDIQSLLKNKESNQLLGERLVEKELLSPYMLSFILKEQVKIRLSEIMSYPSFTLSILEKPSESSETADINFNEIDLIEWLAESLQTELNKDFLKNFFLEMKFKLIQKSSQINKALIYQKKFLQKYNMLFKSLKENRTVEDIINVSENKSHTLRLLYFGLLTKSISLKNTKKEVIDLKNFECFLDSIIEKDSEDLFAVLNLPWDATPKEVKKNYQQLLQNIHSNTLPENASEQLKEKYEKAFYKITKSYEILKDEEKRDEYIRVQKEEDFVTVMNKYEEGMKKIEQGQYKRGIEILEQVSNHKHSPSNTILYLLWAKLKSGDQILYEDRKKAAQISKDIDLCPISLRTSPLFWYVKGLFCVKTRQYKKAEELFKKSLKIENHFLEAKKELVLLKPKLKSHNLNSNNKILDFFLKKSG